MIPYDFNPMLRFGFMHEMSLCESVISVIEQQAQVQQFQQVSAVWLEIGVLSDVEPDAMRFSFELVKQGTIAEQARLEIIGVPGQARCERCQTQVDIQQLYDPCPQCGGHQLQITDGQQMRIKELEVR